MKFLLLVLYINLFAIVFGQNHIHLNGNVISSDSSEPVSGAQISILGRHDHVHTDVSGKFELPFKNDSMPIIVFCIAKGYEDIKILIPPFSKDTAIVIALTRKVQEISEVSIVSDKPVSAASSSYFSMLTFGNRPRNSAQDLLRLVPGLFIAQHAGGGKAEQIFVRGFDCDHGTDVATYVDGIPVNMPSHGHGQGYSDLHFLIPDVVSGINVFKGTSFAQFGDFSTGATIQFKTLDSLTANCVLLETGGVVTKNKPTNSRLQIQFQLPEKNSKITAYCALDYAYNSGFFDVNQNMKRFNVFHKTTIQLSTFTKLQFSYSGFGSDWNASGQIPERAVKNGLISRFGSIDPHEGGTTQRNNFNVVLSQKTQRGSFELQTYAFQYRFRLFSNFTFFLNDTINGDMIEQGDTRFVTGANANYSQSNVLLGKKGKWSCGVNMRSDEIDNQLWHSPSRIRENIQAHALIHQRSTGVYMSQQLNLSSKLHADIGLRWDNVLFDVEDLILTDSNHTNYSGINSQSGLHPKFNLQYTATEKWILFFNAGTGYHSNDARSSVQQIGMKQLPLAISSEIGTLVQLKKTVISLALWEMEMDNELVFVGDDGTTENKGSSRRLGMDVSLRAPLTKSLFLDGDLNWARSRFTTNLFHSELTNNYFIPLAPKFTFSYGLTFKKNKLECMLNARTMASRPANEDNTIVAHGYTVVMIGAAYKWKKWKWNCSIDNLINVKWNEAQFATETRLKNESQPVKEIHFTPGTPFSFKTSLFYFF